MPLHENQIAAMAVRWRMPEMAVADVVECGSRLEARDMAAELRTLLVGAKHDRKGIPSDDRTQLVLDGAVARQRGLLIQRNRVAIGCRQRLLDAEAAAARSVNHRIDDEFGPLIATVTSDRRQGIQPLPGFLRIQIVRVRDCHYSLPCMPSRRHRSLRPAFE